MTRYRYDAFGRLKEVRRPGAGEDNPATETYVYTDAWPFTVRHAQRSDDRGDADPQATYRTDYTFSTTTALTV